LSKHVCCSSPASTRYWFAVSMITGGLLSLIGQYWHPLGPASASTILLATGVGCVANWRRHRTFHCAISGPLLLIAGTVFLLSDIGFLNVPTQFVWAVVGAGLGIAFLLETRYAGAAK